MKIKLTLLLVVVAAVSAFGWIAGGRLSNKVQPDTPAILANRDQSTEAPNTNEGASTSAGSRIDHGSPSELVRAVDVIVVATWVADEEKTIGLASAIDGAARAERVDVLRSFRTVEVLKGSAPPPQFVTRTTRSNSAAPRGAVPGSTMESEVAQLKVGTQYVLFLKQLTDEQGGGLGFWGEPRLAEVSPTALKWIVSNGYRLDKQARRIGLGANGAAAAFDISLDELRRLATTLSP